MDHSLAGYQGRVFHGNAAAAGLVLPIYSNTAQKFGLWNPLGNTKVAEIIRVSMTYVDTTGAAGGFCLAHVKNAGAAVATGGNISAFTDGTQNVDTFNGRIGNTTGPTCRFTPSAATVTAPVIGRQLGINQLVLTAADATNPQWRAEIELNGELWLEPGNAIFLAGNIAMLSKFAPTIVWQEQVL